MSGSGGACAEFKQNPFRKNVCQTCFKSKSEHGAGTGEGQTTESNDKEVLKSGYLTKAPPDLSGKFGAKPWKKRWFVLTSDSVLTYYDSEKTYPKKPLGDINLAECSSVSEADVETKQQYSLGLSTPKRIYYVKSDNKEDIDSWNTAIQEKMSGTRPTRSATERVGSTSSSSPSSSPRADGEPVSRLRGLSQMIKPRARSMASDGSRRETLSMSRRQRQGSVVELDDTPDDAMGAATVTSPSTDDWDTLDDVDDKITEPEEQEEIQRTPSVSSTNSEPPTAAPKPAPRKASTVSTPSPLVKNEQTAKADVPSLSDPSSSAEESSNATTPSIFSEAAAVISDGDTSHGKLDITVGSDNAAVTSDHDEIDAGQREVSISRPAQEADERLLIAEVKMREKSLRAELSSRSMETEALRTSMLDLQKKTEDEIKALTQSKKEMTEANVELKLKLEGLSSTSSKAEAETHRLSEELAEVKKETASRTEELEALKIAKAKLEASSKDELATLQQQLAVAQSSLASKEEQGASESHQFQAMHDKLQAEISSQSSQIDQLSAELASKEEQGASESHQFQAMHDKLQAEISSQSSQIDQLSAELTTMTAELQDSQNTVKTLEVQVKEQRQANREMMDKLAEEGEAESREAAKAVEAEKERMKRQQRRSASEYTLQIMELNDQVKKMEELEEVQSEHEKTIQQLNADLSQAHAALASAREENAVQISALEQQVKRLKEDVAAAKQDLSEASEHGERVVMLQESLKEERDKNHQLESELAEATKMAASHQETISQNKAEKESLVHQHQIETNSFQEKISDMEKIAKERSLKDADDRVQVSEARSAVLQEKLDEATRKLAELKKSSGESLLDLKDEIQELRATTAAAEASRSKLEQEKLDHLDELQNSRQEVSRLTTDLEETKRRLEQATMSSSGTAKDSINDHMSKSPPQSLPIFPAKGKSTTTTIGSSTGISSGSNAVMSSGLTLKFAGKSNAAVQQNLLATDVHSSHLSTHNQLDDLQQRNVRLMLEAERRKQDALSQPNRLTSPGRTQTFVGRSMPASPVSPAPSFGAMTGKSRSVSTTSAVSSTAASPVRPTSQQSLNQSNEPPPPAKPKKPVLVRTGPGRSTSSTASSNTRLAGAGPASAKQG